MIKRSLKVLVKIKGRDVEIIQAITGPEKPLPPTPTIA
jgi:hypothetical protein